MTKEVYERNGLMKKGLELKYKVGEKYMAHAVKEGDCPWWMGETVPIEITKEYPWFYEARVLEHKQPGSLFNSMPYSIHINKTALLIGNLILR